MFIISWLFIPILLLFVFSFFTISENLGKTILYSLNFFSIVSYFNGIRNNPVDIPIILTLISSFVLYCYIFDKIQEGTEIQKDKDDIYQKFFPVLIWSLMLSLVIIGVIASNLKWTSENIPYEYLFIFFMMGMYIIILIIYSGFHGITENYKSLLYLNRILNSDYSFADFIKKREARIHYSLYILNIWSLSIFFLILMSIFIGYFYHFNLFSLILIISILFIIHILFSNARLENRDIFDIYLTSNDVKNDVIILSEWDDEYLLLFSNNSKTSISKSVIREIFNKSRKVSAVSLDKDSRKPLFSSFIIGLASVVIFLILSFIGALTVFFIVITSNLYPSTLIFLIWGLVLLGCFLLYFSDKVFKRD